MFLCGDFGPHCGACASVGDFLCDFPVGDGKTCDMPLCERHASELRGAEHTGQGCVRQQRQRVHRQAGAQQGLAGALVTTQPDRAVAGQQRTDHGPKACISAAQHGEGDAIGISTKDPDDVEQCQQGFA